MNRNYLKKQDGFTLVEMLIALTLLLLVALSFIPMFVYISEASQNNRVRLIALKLASSKIEEIRALPYEQVGTIGGNPKGVIPREESVDIEGITFTVKTNIWWVDDPSDNDASGNDPLPYDYKRVQVTVTSLSLFTGEVVKTAEISTLASLEGEEEAYPGGNIRVMVQRGWQKGSEPEPVRNAKVELNDGPSAPQTQFTDEMGKVLFAILEEGPYSVNVDPQIQGLMTRPDHVKQEVEVVEGITQTLIFEVEYPCYLEVRLIDKDTDEPITKDGTIILQTPFTGDVVKTFTSDMNGVISTDIFGDVWPVGEGSFGNAYGLKVLAEGYLPYIMSDNPEDADWNGTFKRPGEKQTVTIKLTPANAHIRVIDNSTGVSVTGASVQVHRHNSNCSSQPVAEAVTNEDGTVSFNLPESNGTYYCVRVTKEGYSTFHEHRAFQVINGQQIGIDEVRLVPVNVSIRVKVTGLFGIPLGNVRIRVEGPDGYNEEKRTNSNGEALFTNLKPGWYTVYRRTLLGWDSKTVNTVNGEYIVEF
ncbi:MAG: carboxypeptidase-like regulatory domain-containing protein [Thermoanaerobacterales bacterium]|nr:carboxypeptidase-like regulatory domain-containing protein [Thermoanaerobacterales bacterium]